MKAITKILAGALIASGMTLAQADPITGAFSISGAVAPLPGAPMNDATGLDFAGATSTNSCTGDIATAVGGATCNGAIGTILDIAVGTITGSGVVSISPSISNWITLSLGGVEFDLSTITLINRVGGVLPQLGIEGTGVMRATGFDATPGFFSLTAQGAAGSFSFSSTQISTERVPEPGTLALLGLGLAGLGFVARRRKH